MAFQWKATPWENRAVEPLGLLQAQGKDSVKALGRLASHGRIHRLVLKLARKFQRHAPQLRLLQLTAEALRQELTQLIWFQTAAIGLHQSFQPQLQSLGTPVMPMQIQQQRPQITAAAAALTIQFLQRKSLSTQQLAQCLLAAPFRRQ